MSTFDFKALRDRYTQSLSMEQKPDLAEIPRLLAHFAHSLDKRYGNPEFRSSQPIPPYMPISLIPDLKFLYSKNTGNGPNAVLKILNCHHDFPDRFNATAAGAASSALTTLGYTLNHARFWSIPSIINRAVQALAAKPIEEITFNRLIQSLTIFEHGAWLVKFFDDWISYVPVPEIRQENGIPHCEDGPALSIDLPQTNVREWFLQGVRVDEQLVLRPETQTIGQIQKEENQEIRRIRTDRYGWPRYLQDVGAESLEIRYNERDQQWEQLYKLPDGEKRFVVSDPSTGRKYALRVEDSIDTCHQAQQWMSQGLDSLAVHRS